MNIRVIEEALNIKELVKIGVEGFGDMVKAVVDVERKIMSVKSSSFDWTDLRKKIEVLAKEMDQYPAEKIKGLLIAMVQGNQSKSEHI